MSDAIQHHRSFGAGWRWGCLALLALGIVGLFIGATRLILQPGPAPAGPLPTAELRLATPTPTATPTPVPTPTPIPPTPVSAAGIGIGSRVQVSGTGAAGLNLRIAPGTGSERVTVAAEGSLFIVAGGPQEADGLTWWLLKDESNPEREGWGAANFLVQTP